MHGLVGPAVSEKLYEDVPLMALNHISRLCKSVDASVRFYVKALGFVLIHRPPALHFTGTWYVTCINITMCKKIAYSYRDACASRLFNYGVGIHLVQRDDARKASDVNPGDLDPMDNHISFQARPYIPPVIKW